MKSQLVDILFCCDTNGLWKYLVLLSTSTLSNNQISSWCLLGLDDDKLSTNCSCWLSAILLMITLPILGYSFTVILTFHFPPILRSFYVSVFIVNVSPSCSVSSITKRFHAFWTSWLPTTRKASRKKHAGPSQTSQLVTGNRFRFVCVGALLIN